HAHSTLSLHDALPIYQKGIDAPSEQTLPAALPLGGPAQGCLAERLFSHLHHLNLGLAHHLPEAEDAPIYNGSNCAEEHQHHGERDRKSTRLNSSHVKI